MSIKNFYMPRYFEKRNSKRFLQGFTVFWSAYLIYAILEVKSPFLLILLSLLCLYQIIGTAYMLKNGIYLKSGEKYKKPQSVPPEEFLKQVKKEVAHGKK